MTITQIKFIFALCISTLISTSGLTQKSIKNLSFEINIGSSASSNLNTLGSAPSTCCFDYIFASEKSALGLNYSLALDYKLSTKNHLKFGFGFSRTRREVSVATVGGIVAFPPVFMNDHTIVESHYLYFGHTYKIPINKRTAFTIENGLAIHRTYDFLTMHIINTKTYFLNYMFKIGSQIEFTELWSITPKIVLDSALTTQDNDDEYLPINIGLEVSIAYKL